MPRYYSTHQHILCTPPWVLLLSHPTRHHVNLTATAPQPGTRLATGRPIVRLSRADCESASAHSQCARRFDTRRSRSIIDKENKDFSPMSRESVSRELLPAHWAEVPWGLAWLGLAWLGVCVPGPPYHSGTWCPRGRSARNGAPVLGLGITDNNNSSDGRVQHFSPTPLFLSVSSIAGLGIIALCWSEYKTA